MRFAITPALFILTACRSGVPTLDSAYQEATNLYNVERFDDALPKVDQGLARAERNGTERQRWQFRLLKADLLIGQRERAKTLELLNQYGEPPATAEWDAVRGHLLLLKGRASSELGHLKEAEDLLAQAAATARTAGSAWLSAEVQLRQGKLLLQQSKFGEARDMFRDVAEAAAKNNDPYQQATAVGNIGFELQSESRYEEAIPWLESAQALFTQTDARESVARAHGNLGTCYFYLGDYDNARVHYEKAQEAFARTGNREGQQLWIAGAGNVYLQTGDFRAAAKAYQRAREIARQLGNSQSVGRWANNLAQAYLQLNDADSAERFSNEALASIENEDNEGWKPSYLLTAAQIQQAKGNLSESRKLFQSVLTQRTQDPALPLDAHAGLANLWIREGRTKEAENEFRSTVAGIEQGRTSLLKDDSKLSYVASLMRLYRDYVDFLVTQHEPERALEVAESSRSQVLASRVAVKDGNRDKAERHTAVEYRRLAREMRAVVLEFWLGPNHSYLWAITGEGVHQYELPPLAEIRRLIGQYQAVTTGARNPLEVAGDTGHRLYEALLAPAGEVARSGRFVIVPDEDLYSFDLESLPAPGDAGKFWIEQATVSIAPSLNFLAGRQRENNSRPAAGLLIIGDAPTAGAQFPRLEYASQEIDSIAHSVGGTRQAILRGEDARPAAYTNAQPGQFGFIHFAAHATANAQSPLDSAVVLSGPTDRNRLLARSVMGIPLAAELVTISACRSAGGKAYAGEGLVGFAWAFLRAGARNVIAGLWDVSDRSTAELMSGLYANVAAGEDVPTALRAAKLDLIHKGGAYAKPFYWAPFQLYVGTTR
jgi:CHAT domain-containing protein